MTASSDASTAAAFALTNLARADVLSVSVGWGTSGTAPLQTDADGVRLLAAGRNVDLPWLGIRTITITLDEAESLSASDISVTGVTVANYGPVTITGSGTTYTITLARSIDQADRVTLTIGNAGIATYTRQLDVLPGDVNDDGVVSLQDAVIERNGYLGFAPVLIPLVMLDVLGDGSPDVNSDNIIRRLIGTSLP